MTAGIDMCLVMGGQDTGSHVATKGEAMKRCGMFKRALLQASVAICGLAFAGTCAAQSIEVKEAWLKRNCLDKGTADHPLMGKEFETCLRKQIESLPALDKSKRELFGELYNPPKYVECRLRPESRNNSACNVYILRRRDWPEYWPENAVRPRWPEAPKESVYRRGMKPKEYWEALCKAEAGEFIYKTVKDVEGFLLVRPRAAETDYAMQDKYVVEDAYGAHESQFVDRETAPGRGFFQLAKANYRAIEAGVRVAEGTRMWVRQEILVDKLEELLRSKTEKWDEEKFTRVSYVNSSKSRYGIVWRGIRRPEDASLGISGGELAIADLTSGQIIALRRGFAVDGFAVRGTNGRHSWLSSWGCPVMARDSNSLRAFVNNVLQPPVVTR